MGLGRRATEDYVPALAQAHPTVELVAVCDSDPSREGPALDAYQELLPDNPRPRFHQSAEDALAHEDLDFAIIVTPHHTHLSLARLFLENGLAVLKEKPFAVNVAEARALFETVERTGGNLRLCVQRQLHPLYFEGRRSLAYIGQIRHFTARYQLSVPPYSRDWRADPSAAGGGALIDMGYRLVDLLHWYFGVPTHVHAAAPLNLDPRLDRQVEQTIIGTWCYSDGTVGTIFISNCEPNKEEYVNIAGTHGFITLTRDALRRFDPKNEQVSLLTQEPAWPSTVGPTLHDFIENLSDPASVRRECVRGVEVTQIIDSTYRSMAEHRTIEPSNSW